MMTSVAAKATGLVMFTLGLYGRRALAETSIENCVSLISAVGEASDTVFSLANDMECSGSIVVSSGVDITINGGGSTLTLGPGFISNTHSLFYNNLGKLTLNNVTIQEAENAALASGIRGIYNEGALTVNGCTFNKLNLEATDATRLDRGGAIYTNSDGEDVVIENCVFSSNFAANRGGAIIAEGSDVLMITESDFSSNESGLGDDENGSGADIYAGSDVDLSVVSCTFSNSVSEIGGAAIECCSARIIDTSFLSSDASGVSSASYGGGLLVGRPDGNTCDSSSLTVYNSTFSGCSVDYAVGAGGAVAMFDTTATFDDCIFENNRGSAVMFQSSDDSGAHTLTMDRCFFNENANPAIEFTATDDKLQGAAVVMRNTGAADGEEVTMGELTNIYCFGNNPYECEFVYDRASTIEAGEFRCQICDTEGARQEADVDNFESTDDRSVDSSSSDSNEGMVIGLSLALGLTLVVIGALAVWKFRVRKNARRLMEEMGEGDL